MKEAPAPEISAALGLAAAPAVGAPASGAPVVGAALSEGLHAARTRATDRVSKARRAGFRFMLKAPYNEEATISPLVRHEMMFLLQADYGVDLAPLRAGK